MHEILELQPATPFVSGTLVLTNNVLLTLRGWIILKDADNGEVEPKHIFASEISRSGWKMDCFRYCCREGRW